MYAKLMSVNSTWGRVDTVVYSQKATQNEQKRENCERADLTVQYVCVCTALLYCTESVGLGPSGLLQRLVNTLSLLYTGGVRCISLHCPLPGPRTASSFIVSDFAFMC